MCGALLLGVLHICIPLWEQGLIAVTVYTNKRYMILIIRDAERCRMQMHIMDYPSCKVLFSCNEETGLEEDCLAGLDWTDVPEDIWKCACSSF